jgi:hypothetical protein
VAVNDQDVPDNRRVRVGRKAAVHGRFNENRPCGPEKVRCLNGRRDRTLARQGGDQ